MPGDRPSGGRDGPLGLADRVDELLLRLEVWRERPGLVPVLIAVTVLLAGCGWWLSRPPDPVAVEDLIPVADPASVDESEAMAAVEAAAAGGPVAGPLGVQSQTLSGEGGSDGTVAVEQLVVHVVGAVSMPGLVVVAAGGRIDDAVAAAGGVTDSADVDRLNLAAPLADGMQIRVPEIDEEITGALVVTADRPTPTGAAAVDGGLVDLNTATDGQLQDLPGIGPATAAAIIAWRTEHGGFLTVDDLTSVPGIGPAKLAALSDLVTV